MYRATRDHRGWIIICPDGSVYPVFFGDNKLAAEHTAVALNLAIGVEP